MTKKKKFGCLLLVALCIFAYAFKQYLLPMYDNYSERKECEGCLTVSRPCQMKMLEIYESTSSEKPVLIFAKYEE